MFDLLTTFSIKYKDYLLKIFELKFFYIKVAVVYLTLLNL
jgi:hypothetical protein